GPTLGTDRDVGHGGRATLARPGPRGRAQPSPQWTHRDGQFTHHPGHANDLMSLRTPLRGDFQLDCELTSFGWREMRIIYGGMTVAPNKDLKHVRRWHFNRELPEISLDPPLTALGGWYKYRLLGQNRAMAPFLSPPPIPPLPPPS